MKFTLKQRNDLTSPELKDILHCKPLDTDSHNSITLLKTLFSTFLCDNPSDTHASITRLASLLKEFGLIKVESEEDMQLLLDTVDKDKDGKFTFSDFVNNIPMFEHDKVFGDFGSAMTKQGSV